MSRTEMEAEISEWRKFGADAVHIIANIVNQRVSYTMTEHRAADLQQQNIDALKVIETGLSEMLASGQRQ